MKIPLLFRTKKIILATMAFLALWEFSSSAVQAQKMDGSISGEIAIVCTGDSQELLKELSHKIYPIGREPGDSSRRVLVEGRSWSVIITLPYSELQGVLDTLKNIVATTTLLTLFLALVGSFVFASGITKPISKLVAMSGLVAKRDFSHRLEVKSRDELGALAFSFNKMVEELQGTTVSRDYVENIISSMRDMLIVVSRNAEIQTINQFACDMLGYQKTELLGKPAGMIFSGKDFLEGSRFEALIKNGLTKDAEKKMLSKSGLKIPVFISGSVLRDKSGEALGLVLVDKDFSERKQLEKQLRCAKEQAEAANRAKSEFLGNMTHELRTPLNSVIGFSRFLQGTELNKEQYEFVEIINTCGDNLLRIITQILDLTKIESGKFDLEEAAFGFRRSIDRLLSTFALEAKQIK